MLPINFDDFGTLTVEVNEKWIYLIQKIDHVFQRLPKWRPSWRCF
jgi:hypothetical protein